MVNVFNIIVTSAMLVLGNDVNNPVPYCTVQIQQQGQQPRPEYDLFENPEGGCKELGALVLEAVQEQEPNAAVTLTVDGVSNNDI
ncbi:hypothetical protein SU503_06 [Klebsiella phage vB_KpnP_SU503]|uniref:Uncharacterized protein n=1 Tax=Klebsiella phage vB_KpnP_SU503 TaxID=1610834 RepID=A0A0C5Q3V2_9CAUD|nr:hypothetical protein AVT68_gp07 [Klebsiella phage vB_KpnP_SU503]AJQ21068.1 hypothetical protein SU503_06 [Klebsiella phage vB_KpnP_SU503]